MSLIEVRGFKKSFEDKVVHRDVSFTVEKGSCLGLIGGSGQGKSVILRSLIGLEKPDAGQILIDGTDITHFAEDQLVEVRKRIAYVFQNGALFDSMSVYENLAYPLREHTNCSEQQIFSKITFQLKEFGLEDSKYLFPSELSGGMQKRVGLARSIIMGPEVVLYDEPTAGLDPFNTKKIQSMILALKKKGVTSILVTHDMPTAFAVCDRMALLNRGTIISNGTIEDMKKDPNGIVNKFISGETDL